MIWLYERNDETLRLETTFDNAAVEYVLIQHHPGGRTVTERFASEGEFRVRLTALGAALDAERWRQKGPPLLMNEGWKI